MAQTSVNVSVRLVPIQVKFAEIRMSVRDQKGPNSGIYRLVISNDAGYLLTLQLYREVTDPTTGAIKFVSFFPESGPWHGLPVNTPYMTKDFLEMKRSKAHALETTFVYDYPGNKFATS